MIAEIHKVRHRAKRALYDQTLPFLAALYRYNADDSSGWLLRALGIADPTYRTDFYTLTRIIDSIDAPGGTIAECGVYRGSTLLGMAHRLRTRGLKMDLIGFDSFEGFPEPDREDALPDGTYHPQAIKGVFNDAQYNELVRKIRLLGYSNNIRLVRGYFEDTLIRFKGMRFSLVHLDCDLYQSYMTCLKFFYSRIVPGGYIVFDEYDFSRAVYPGAKKAIDSFLADKSEKLMRFSDAASPRYFICKQ